MGRLTLAALLEATAVDRLGAVLAPWLGRGVDPPVIESTRLQAPICAWIVYRRGRRRVTLKSFFQPADADHYLGRLADYYPDRMERIGHPAGGIGWLPEVNGILWGFPFDPSVFGLGRAVDGAWAGNVLGRADPLDVSVVNYHPEIAAVLAYRDRATGDVVAYGKSSAEPNAGLVYLVMDRLWRSPAHRRGDLILAQPLAFRPEAGLLLQAPLPGRPIGRERNRRVFLDLAHRAGAAIAAVHATPIPFGPTRSVDRLIQRLIDCLPEVALLAPRRHRSLRQLTDQLAHRAAGSRPEPAVGCHGDFKYDQFLAADGQFGLIDFELFCRSEPALDLGTFAAYLPPTSPDDWRDGAAAEALRAAFFAADEAATGRSIDFRRIALHEAAMLATRGLSHLWTHRPGWELQMSQLVDLAWERLVNPEPTAGGTLPLARKLPDEPVLST